MDHIKFKLKPGEEIIEALKDKDNLFVVHCNKCYREFTEVEDGDCSKIVELLKDKNFAGCMKVEFLCNLYKSGERIKAELGKGEGVTVAVHSCGLGIQAVAEMLGREVVALSNSVPQNGYHGMALSPEKCHACGECVLSFTGGICPVADCSKSLLSGQCGGAKKGKCEVSPDKECAWENIYKRLEKLKRNDTAEFTRVRNYNNPGFKTADSDTRAIRDRKLEGFYGGIYPEENKERTADKPIELFPLPSIVVIPLSQHTGAPCEPLVKPGDSVRTGQKIGESKSFISAPVHSSVSGKVIAVRPEKHPVIGAGCLSVVIEAAQADSFDPSVKPADPSSLKPEQIREIIREKGIVGLGGAQFPTHVKLKSPKPVDTLLVNGCECEPWLNADNRLMMEQPEKIIEGAKILMKALSASSCVIAVEENKPEALKILSEKAAGTPSISIAAVKTKYPQGAEKTLIKRVLKREVPRGGLPLDAGVVVQNVGTVAAVYAAVVSGLPLIKRIVTVDGEHCQKPGNYEIRTGTLLKDIIKHCFGADSVDQSKYSIVTGGPMMGIRQETADVPVIKGTSAVLVLNKADILPELTRECIKCGRCVDVCPMELQPLYYVYLTKKEQYSDAAAYDVASCIECGCCDYVCPSKLPIVNSARKLKKYKG